MAKLLVWLSPVFDHGYPQVHKRKWRRYVNHFHLCATHYMSYGASRVISFSCVNQGLCKNICLKKITETLNQELLSLNKNRVWFFFLVGGGKLWYDQYGSRDDSPKKCGRNTTSNRFYATFQAGHLRNRGGNEGAIILFYINVCFTLTTDRKIKDWKRFSLLLSQPPNTGRQFDDFRWNWKISQNSTRSSWRPKRLQPAWSAAGPVMIT